jgi:hypothetical protein
MEEIKKECSFCPNPIDMDYYIMYRFGMRQKATAKKDPARKNEIEKLYRVEIHLCENCRIKMSNYIERQINAKKKLKKRI